MLVDLRCQRQSWRDRTIPGISCATSHGQARTGRCTRPQRMLARPVVKVETEPTGLCDNEVTGSRTGAGAKRGSFPTSKNVHEPGASKMRLS